MGSLKSGFNLRQSRSRSHNQKCRMIQSSENKTNRVRSKTLIPFMTVSYYLVKTSLLEAEVEAKE